MERIDFDGAYGRLLLLILDNIAYDLVSERGGERERDRQSDIKWIGIGRERELDR